MSVDNIHAFVLYIPIDLKDLTKIKEDAENP